MSAIQYISQNKNTSWRPLDILFTTSEETDYYGAKNFDKSKIRAKIGYIFDKKILNPVKKQLETFLNRKVSVKNLLEFLMQTSSMKILKNLLSST